MTFGNLHMTGSRLIAAGLLGVCITLPAAAQAHPHVFVEANLDIVQNEAGEATHIRHVWRFDELFSSSLLLDFDDNGNGQLDVAELQEIASVTSQSIAEYNFYTEIRNGDQIINFYEPDPYIVDMQDGQLLIILSVEIEKPVKMNGNSFRVAVSDPTYYVAIDFLSDDAVQVSGGKQSCSHDIVPPDWDALYAEDAQRLADLFAAPADAEVTASDDYLTWVHFACS